MKECRGSHYQGKRIFPALNCNSRKKFFNEIMEICKKYFNELDGEELRFELNLARHKAEEYYNMQHKGRLLLLKEHSKKTKEVTEC